MAFKAMSLGEIVQEVTHHSYVYCLYSVANATHTLPSKASASMERMNKSVDD